MKRNLVPKFKISIPFVILVSVMYLLNDNLLFFSTMLAIVIHEGAHITAVSICGGSIDKVEIRAFGIRVNVPELKYMSYKKEIIIAAMGPLAGIFAASISLLAANMCKMDWGFYFAGINIIITAINLIPVYPLDGGRIILSFMLWFFPLRVAYTLSYILTMLSIGVLFGLCVMMAFYRNLNPTLVIFSLYIAVCGIKSRTNL